MKSVVMTVLLGCVWLLPTRSFAQGTPDESGSRVAPAGGDGSAAPAAPAGGSGSGAPVPAEAVRDDGVRFRGGVAAVGGGEFVSDFAFGMGGVEGRAGVQINHLIGVYVQPYLAFGAGSVGSGATAATGTLGVSALVDFTIADLFFVGAGGGFGILNNPVGPEIHFRLGAYPVVGIGQNGIRRRGLMVGLDARLFFLDDVRGVLPVLQLMAGVGYEAF